MSTPSSPLNAQPDVNMQQLLQQALAQQSNTQGLTQMAPAVPNMQATQPNKPQDIPQQPTRPVGPGQGPARKAQDTQNFAAAATNIANRAVYAYEQRKSREQQQ